MSMELIVGLLASAVPLLAVGYLMLRRQPGIFRMFIAMVVVGLGYLTATGAMDDIGRKVLGIETAEVPADAAAPAPPAEPAAAPTPPSTAPADATPPADSAAPPEGATAPAAEDSSGEPPPAPEMPDTGAAPPPAEGETAPAP